MSAALRRQAATILRERAEAATPGEWTKVPGASNVWHFPDDESRAPAVVVNGTGGNATHRRSSEASNADAAYIATVDPSVGLALADWLDQSADRLDRGHHSGSRHADILARLIVGAR